MPKFKIGSSVIIDPAGTTEEFEFHKRQYQQDGTVGKVVRYDSSSPNPFGVLFPGSKAILWCQADDLASTPTEPYTPAIGGAPNAGVQRRSAIPGFSGVGVTTEQVYVLGMKVTEKGEAIRLTDPAPYVNTHHDLASERRQFEDTLIYVITDDPDGDGFTVTEGGQFYASYRVTAYCCPQVKGK